MSCFCVTNFKWVYINVGCVASVHLLLLSFHFVMFRLLLGICGRHGGFPGGGGYSQKNWVGVCGTLPKTLSPFMSKICNIPCPIYDLTKNSKPSLWPDPDIKILFQTCIIISSEVRTNFKLPIMMKKWLLLKNIPILRLEYKNHALFMTRIS